MIYLIHFDTKLHHAQHYLGYCTDGNLEARVKRHASGNGSRLMAAVIKAGIVWRVVRTWPGNRSFERHLKKRKNTARLCPTCQKDEDDTPSPNWIAD